MLGHPEHLISRTELDHAVPKRRGAVRDQLDNLIDAGILDLYRHEPSETTRDYPSKFYGLTERGVEILYEYNYLRGVPVARALYENTRKSAKVERHENAPRPELPDAVREALSTADEREQTA
ncbi:ArsR family transcriptional regulator [Halorussus amylolyticus]|uniref:ArsR family transcriptional regulator n=1 Tax=Halorussus amylolyticus TaxID=1126242 RepID=UPI001EE4506F|nr:ArsR family transcriptional regulator [Halorussus amylolyticus]